MLMCQQKTAGSRPEVSKSPISRPEATQTSGSRPEVNNPCYYCVKEDWHCETRVDRRTGHPCLSCLRCATKKIKCHPASGIPPSASEVRPPPSGLVPRHLALLPPLSVSLAVQDRTRSQSRGVSRTPAVPAATAPKVQSHGRSKTTGRKTPAPAPAPAPATAAVPSSSAAVPRAALDVPMLDLHSMAIAIRDGAACIAILEARVWEQDGKIDTLQRLHESLQRQVVNWHPSFPLPDLPANATMLLDQSIPPPSMSPLPSALPNLINLDMGVMEPTPLKVEDASDVVGLVFEPSQVQPEGPQSSSEIVAPDDPGNLLPEYNSVSEEMDVEVKAGTSGEEVEMAA
ncbi:hypothetical protein EDD22DRAFT_943271 [Suillus occidentalis]|nr:hypothetical protein EDD22DRAFT_943271 [Suillus occidentalis]